MIYPLKEIYITSPYGKRPNPFDLGLTEFHNGVDLRANKNKVYSVADGVVKISKFSPSYGNYIVIQHEGFCSLYAHLDSFLVKVNDEIHLGDIIAISGATGRVDGAHLHFEIREMDFSDKFFISVNGKQPNTVNPLEFIDTKNLETEKENVQLWKYDALKKLHEKSLLNDYNYWYNNINEPMPTWAVLALMNSLAEALTEQLEINGLIK
jgi:murein DD-endopeptidase MepM/ murein hydrolase activator NlpD